MGPRVTEIEMELFYDKNDAFKTYVDRYSKKHKITPKEAMRHMLVKYAYTDYYEKSKQPEENRKDISKENVFDEDKSC